MQRSSPAADASSAPVPPRSDWFRAPATPADVVAREAVIRHLRGAVGRTVAVTAPGGYGKTSQVAIWAARDGRPVRWVPLGIGDDDAASLFALLGEALAGLIGRDTGATTDDCAGPERYSPGAAASWAGAIGRCAIPFVLVLDDVHLLTNDSAIELVASIAQNLPAQATLVLTSRSRPGPAFARARLDPGIIDIGTAELALDRTGVAALLRSIDVAADEQIVDRVIAETEGWPAGVRLVGLELAGADAGPRERNRMHGGPALAVAEYVQSEWLRGVRPAEREFLMRVSGLEWLSGPLCDHVLQRSDSGRVLRDLHENRRTVLPLDRHGASYRMHRILGDVLLDGFDQVDRRERQRVDLRASDWFEQDGDIERAVRHAVRGGDFERATQLVEAHAVAFQTLGRHSMVADWLALLPRSLVVTRPTLCLASAVSALGTCLGDEALVWTQMALATTEGRSCHPTGRDIDLQASAFHALIGSAPMEALLKHAVDAHRGLRPGHWRAVACEAYGALAFASGEIETACDLFREGGAEAAVAGARTDEAHCYAHLAVALEELGDLQLGREATLKARAIVADHHLADVPTLILVSAVSALAAARDGDTGLADSEMGRTVANAAHFSSIAGLINIQVRITLARTALALGDRSAAAGFLDEARGRTGSWSGALTPHRQIAAIEDQIRSTANVQRSPSMLTPAEMRVLQYLPTNLRHHEIASRLFLSRNTVKTHASSIYRKLGVTSRTEAVDTARSVGLLASARDAAGHRR